MKKLIYLVAITFTLLSCYAQEKKIELVAPAAFAQKIQEDKGQIVDVRTPKEYKSGHIDGAVNMHVYDNDFETRLDSLDKNKTVYIYCKAGGRSAEAVETMKDKGFNHIVELDGGTDAWVEAGKPLKQ
jgi:phage shock protein E